jgi:hypothetical protein
MRVVHRAPEKPEGLCERRAGPSSCRRALSPFPIVVEKEKVRRRRRRMEGGKKR